MEIKLVQAAANQTQYVTQSGISRGVVDDFIYRQANSITLMTNLVAEGGTEVVILSDLEGSP